MNADIQIIDLTPDNIADYGVCGYKNVQKHKELRNKIEWFKKYYSKGLKIKALISEKGGYQGMLEYIPGKYAHRPVRAEGYLFIHCIFVGFKKEYKGKGYASALIDECILDAKDQGMLGISIVARKGSFMVDREIFVKKGFKTADRAEPDFELLVLKFDEHSESPGFNHEALQNTGAYDDGLTILRSPQCPYTEKNVNAIIETAEKNYQIKTNLIEIVGAKEAQETPCAFGSFCILYDGKVISDHPISSRRFENIINKKIKE